MRYLIMLAVMTCAAPTLAWAQPEREVQAAQLTRAYLETWSSNGKASLSQVRQVYAPQVYFYGRRLTHSALEAEKRRFLARWPSREYALRPDSVSVSCDSRFCVVSGILDWSAESVARGAVVRGVSSLVQTFDFSAPRPVVVAEYGVVIRQARRT
jgi:hypothetical protein